MADSRVPPRTQATDRKKKKFRSDGTPIWGKRYIEGPGVWVSCVKGKESQAVAECYDLFESVASRLWPLERSPTKEEEEVEDSDGPGSSTLNDSELSIEAQIANEVSAMKRLKTEPRFVNCQTNTTCVVFISCKPPVDPVKLIAWLVRDVESTGVVGSRYIHRLVPVSASCVTNLPEIQALCRSILTSFFSQHPEKKYTYKIELRMRNHSVHTRPILIQHIAQCVPEGHAVALDDPEIFILVEVFKSIFGISIVKGYYRLQKFNIMEIATTVRFGGDHQKDSRVPLQPSIADSWSKAKDVADSRDL